MHAADVGAEAGGVGVFGDGDKDFDVVGGGAAFELRSRLYHISSARGLTSHLGALTERKTDLQGKFDPRPRMTPHITLHPNQRLHLRIQPIAHKFKFAIRRDETNRPIILKSRQSHTLMEFHILHLHALPSRRSSRAFKHHFVVQPKPQFGHSREVAFQFYGAENLGTKDVTGGGDEEVERFNDVEEDFVFTVANPFGAPGDGVGDGDRGAGLDLELVGFLRYVSRIPIVSASHCTFSRDSPLLGPDNGNWNGL